MQRTRPVFRTALLGAALLLTLLGSHGAALAGATITVNTTADELNSDGDCSLREAIQAANTDSAVDACPAGSGDDTITLPSGTFTLTSGSELILSSNLTLIGAGSQDTIIQAATSFGVATHRVLNITNTVDLEGITVRFGHEESDAGGGITNSGQLTLTSVRVMSNSVGGSFTSGGIHNSGTLNLMSSTVSNNTAHHIAGITNISFSAVLVITDSHITGNVRSGSGNLNRGISGIAA